MLRGPPCRCRGSFRGRCGCGTWRGSRGRGSGVLRPIRRSARQDDADETDDRVAVEDPDWVGAASDLAVESLGRIVGPGLLPQSFGECGKREHVVAGPGEVLGDIGQAVVDVVDEPVALGRGGCCVELVIDRVGHRLARGPHALGGLRPADESPKRTPVGRSFCRSRQPTPPPCHATCWQSHRPSGGSCRPTFSTSVAGPRPASGKRSDPSSILSRCCRR